ncbi:hypothetical protein FRB99_000020 [Tulasnella sp. 403]|nr:hypothetical protein FRB99_000020 [Tulasnella sp. 403]
MLESYPLACLLTLVVGTLLWFVVRSTSSIEPKGEGNAFVLTNTVAHQRLLPTPSKHRFSYTTVSLLLALDDLEKGSLNLANGWLFRYHGIPPRDTIWSVCGIRPEAYLTDQFVIDKHDEKESGGKLRKPLTIRQKLDRLLHERGWDTHEIEEIWFATMPSYLGFEGINPLSVYYVYKSAPGGPALWLVVLEVHNTFGEKHIYVLETGPSEESQRSEKAKFDHVWVFLRQFHVSPFNDRSGFYRCSLNAIPPPSRSSDSEPPRPMVLLEMLTSDPERRVKLVASIFAQASQRLDARSLRSTLLRYPFSLLLTALRITYQASILHFSKRLDVYPRPEPVAQLCYAGDPLGDDNNPAERKDDNGADCVAGSIGWQKEGSLERWARNTVEAYIRHKVDELGVAVTLTCTNPLVPSKAFYPTDATAHSKELDQECLSTSNEDCSTRSTVRTPTTQSLDIRSRSPAFFTLLVMAPSSLHALLLGCEAEKAFSVNDRELFLSVFPSMAYPKSWHSTATCSYPSLLIYLTQKLRLSLLEPPESLLPLIPNLTYGRYANPVDELGGLTLFPLVFCLFVVQKVERAAFWFSRTRFVPRAEPWNGWARLDKGIERNEIGSVWRPRT